MCSDYTSIQSGYRGCSTNLQPPNYDAIKDPSRDTFVSEINKSIHQNRNKGGKLWDKK